MTPGLQFFLGFGRGPPGSSSRTPGGPRTRGWKPLFQSGAVLSYLVFKLSTNPSEKVLSICPGKCQILLACLSQHWVIEQHPGVGIAACHSAVHSTRVYRSRLCWEASGVPYSSTVLSTWWGQQVAAGVCAGCASVRGQRVVYTRLPCCW